MSGISGAEAVRAAAACAGTDSEGTSVQVWMNYEPTQKNIKIVYVQCDAWGGRPSKTPNAKTQHRSRSIVLRPSRCP